MAKYDWLASNSAPEGCPMKITSGAFLLADGGSVYVPPAKVHAGWGEKVSIHVLEDSVNALPDRLEITFFSYLENKIYRGTFQLPYELIAELFAQGYQSFEKESGKDTFNAIVAGVAPGGAVAVWLSGTERQVEVFFGNAQETQLDWHQTMDIPRELDRMRVIEDSLSDAIQSDPMVKSMMQRIPVGIWSTYREKYSWQPVFERVRTPPRLEQVVFFNGERDYMLLSQDNPQRNARLPVPKHVSFTDRQAKRAYEITFDEDETLATFKRLGAGSAPMQLVFTADGGQSALSVLVRNPKETVALRRLKSDVWRID